MEACSQDGTPRSQEETDNLTRSTEKVKTNGTDTGVGGGRGGEEPGYFDERRKSSYKEKVLGLDADINMEDEDLDLDDDVSDDDYESEEEEDGPWFSMGMIREEKIEARNHGDKA